MWAVAGDYVHGMVTAVAPHSVTVKVGTTQVVRLAPEDWGLDAAEGGGWVFEDWRPGVREADADGAGRVRQGRRFEEDTGAQASMMAVDNSNGEVIAMVGGRDFALSQFNRATQSQRQVGSSFKIYDYTLRWSRG